MSTFYPMTLNLLAGSITHIWCPIQSSMWTSETTI